VIVISIVSPHFSPVVKISPGKNNCKKYSLKKYGKFKKTFLIDGTAEAQFTFPDLSGKMNGKNAECRLINRTFFSFALLTEPPLSGDFSSS